MIRLTISNLHQLAENYFFLVDIRLIKWNNSANRSVSFVFSICITVSSRRKIPRAYSCLCRLFDLKPGILPGQFSNARFGLLHELAVVGAVGVEGAVVQGGLQGRPFAEELLGGVGEIMGDELLPDILHGQRRRVEHVVGIEAVVAELVHQDLVGGEIGHRLLAVSCWLLAKS